MKPIKIVTTQKDNFLSIRWNPNNVCNYNCRYCFPENNTGNYRSPKDLNLVIENFSYLLDQYIKIGKTKFHIMIAGGEPTLWRELGTFIREMKSRYDIYFTVLSNGSRTLRWWKEHAKEIDDAHLTLHTGEGSVEHIIEVADVLYKAGSKTTVKVLMDPIKWDKGVEWVNYMKKNSKYPWFIQVAPVIEVDESLVKFGEQAYNEEQRKYLRKELRRLASPWWFWKNRKLFGTQIRIHESIATLDNGKKIKATPGKYLVEDWHHFEGWKCAIGLEALYIEWTGEIKGSCSTKLFGMSEYYNILDEQFSSKFKIENKYVTCAFKNCDCMPETHVSKFKPDV